MNSLRQHIRGDAPASVQVYASVSNLYNIKPDRDLSSRFSGSSQGEVREIGDVIGREDS